MQSSKSILSAPLTDLGVVLMASCIEAACNAAGEIADEKRRRGCIHEVELGVQGSGKANDDADAHNEGGVAAVDCDFMLSGQVQGRLQDLEAHQPGEQDIVWHNCISHGAAIATAVCAPFMPPLAWQDTLGAGVKG